MNELFIKDNPIPLEFGSDVRRCPNCHSPLSYRSHYYFCRACPVVIYEYFGEAFVGALDMPTETLR
jgi:hypothetical protein